MAERYGPVRLVVDSNYGAPMGTASVSIRHVLAADVEATSISLARAFHDDPLKLFLTGGKVLSERRVAPFFRAFQQIQLPHGHVYCTDDLGAAAIWAPPGEWKMPLRSVVRNCPTFLKMYGWRFLANLAVLADMEEAHPSARSSAQRPADVADVAGPEVT